MLVGRCPRSRPGSSSSARVSVLGWIRPGIRSGRRGGARSGLEMARCPGRARRERRVPDASPLTVELWDRLLAYGAALGVAGGASGPLPMGTESDTDAWSAYRGPWRPVARRVPAPLAARLGARPARGDVAGLGAAIAGAALPLLARAPRSSTQASSEPSSSCRVRRRAGRNLPRSDGPADCDPPSRSPGRSCAYASSGTRTAALLPRRRRRRVGGRSGVEGESARTTWVSRKATSSRWRRRRTSVACAGSPAREKSDP